VKKALRNCFDDQGNLFVAKNGLEIYMVNSDGKSALFCKVENVSSKTTIWNMRFGPDKNMYAAAYPLT